MNLLRFATRNILRNRRRSSITLAAIVIGQIALLFLWAFIDGVNDQMIDNSTRYLAAHVQVHRAGYHEARSLDLLLPETLPLVAELARDPRVAAVTRRLEGNAIASAGEKSRGVLVVGVDPAVEPQITTLAQTLKAGRFLQPDDGNAMVLGRLTAAALKAGVGDEVVLVTQAADGSVGAGRYRVVGIYDTRLDLIDGVYVLLPLRAAQELYATGPRITSLVVRLNDRAATGPVVATARALSAQVREPLEVLDWRKLLPNVVQSVDFHEVTGYVLLLVLFIVVTIGVTNTVLMAVLERTREFGVMMALGTSRGRIIRMVCGEAFLLGGVGVLAGSLLGEALVGYFALNGIDLSKFGRAVETMDGLTSVIHPLPRLDRLLAVAGVTFATALLAALYPAWKAARLLPVEAIRGHRTATSSASRTLPLPGPLFWRIAMRSIVRNPRRTLLTISATSFGLAAFVFLLSFVAGYLTQIADNSTGYLTAHLQLQHPDFRKELSANLSLPDAPSLLAGLRNHPGVAAAAPRIQNQALISSPLQTQNFMLFGIDPAAERQVSIIERALVAGQPLQAGQNRHIVLGAKLAEKLGVRLGEKVVVMTQAADGTLSSAAYRLTGLFTTESEAFDAELGFITLSAAQQLLALGDRVSTIAVALRDRAQLNEVAAGLQQALGSHGLTVLTWPQLLPEVSQMLDYIEVIVRIVVAIVFSVLAMGVMNTLLMSVLERTREFGVMMALGTAPRAIVRLVIYESVVLALIGTAVGLILGFLLVAWLGETGIDMTRYTRGLKTIPGITGIIYPRFAVGAVALPVGMLLLFSVLAAFYPAWRAGRLDPVPAIRNG